MTSLTAMEVTTGGGNKFLLDKMYMARTFCKKNGLKSSFLAGMVIQRFCLAYMESPPPAVFHDKYQIRKYEKTQQGNLLGGVRPIWAMPV